MTTTLFPARRPAETAIAGSGQGAILRLIPVQVACLQALVVANLVQVAAGFAAAEPSPPPDVVPGIVATAMLGLAAIPLVRAGERLGQIVGIVFCLASMIGMGPHKLFLADGAVLAPFALVGFVLEVVFLICAARTLRDRA